MYSRIQQEKELSLNDDFRLGEYIYMGMGLVGEHRVCISVGYKIEYCIKKAKQFAEADPNEKVGELEACEKFEIE